MKSRSQYLGQSPGVPVANDDHIKDVHIDPSAGPVDAYCLLTLDPEKVRLSFLVPHAHVSVSVSSPTMKYRISYS